MFNCLKDKWKKPFVYRKELYDFSGGIINEFTFAEKSYKDTKHLPRPTRMGRRAIYDVNDVIAWLNSLEVEIVEDKTLEELLKINKK